MNPPLCDLSSLYEYVHWASCKVGDEAHMTASGRKRPLAQKRCERVDVNSVQQDAVDEEAFLSRVMMYR